MVHTRRQFARSLVLAPAALLVLGHGAAAAQDSTFSDDSPANVFFSPCGRPFRAKKGEPYPVADWFKLADANADGQIDHAEFMADTLAFFKVLDRNGDGVISPQEVSFYEQRIAPEVLGMRVEGTSGGVMVTKPRLWRVQGMPGGMGPESGGVYRPGGATGPSTSVDPGGVDPGPEEAPRSQPYDASGKGASPYGFFDEPEPVTAADINFRGLISKGDFLKLADIHFTTLDRNGAGHLTLDTLPMTPVQRRLNHNGRRHR